MAIRLPNTILGAICACLLPAALALDLTSDRIDDPMDTYARVSQGGSGCAGQHLWLEVAPGGLDLTTTRDEQKALYRMNFNQVTEGWNWHPEAAAAGLDFYELKYLPLHTVDEDRVPYMSEDKIGLVQEIRVRWRHDYFLAFDNLYEFIPRNSGDDAGFAAAWPARRGMDRIGLRAMVRLSQPCTAESTTFWKATSAQPEDLTLKKYYLVGRIERIEFVDLARGTVQARLIPSR